MAPRVPRRCCARKSTNLMPHVRISRVGGGGVSCVGSGGSAVGSCVRPTVWEPFRISTVRRGQARAACVKRSVRCAVVRAQCAEVCVRVRVVCVVCYVCGACAVRAVRSGRVKRLFTPTAMGMACGRQRRNSGHPSCRRGAEVRRG